MSNAQVPKIGVMAMVRTSRSMKDETLIEIGISLARTTERLGGRIGAGAHPLAGAVIEALTRWIRPSHAEGDAIGSDPELRHDRDVMNALVDEVIRARKAGGPEAIAAHHDLLSYMFLRMESVRLHASMTALLPGIIFLSLWLVLELNHPFNGDIHVPPDAFAHASEVLRC